MNKLFVFFLGLFSIWLAFNDLVKSDTDFQIPNESETIEESIDFQDASPENDFVAEISDVEPEIPSVEEHDAFVPVEESNQHIEPEPEPEPEIKVFDKSISSEIETPVLVSTEAPTESVDINSFAPTVAESTDTNESAVCHSHGIIKNIKSVVIKTKSLFGEYLKAVVSFIQSFIGNLIVKKS